MKKSFIFFFTITLICNTSCFKKPKLTSSPQYSIIDSLKYVSTIPDDYFHPRGDSICSKILANYKKLTPVLIEKITDTTKSKYKYADFFYYKVGDISLELLSLGNQDYQFPIRELISNEFEIKNKNDQLNLILYELFHKNSSEINNKNRKKIKIVIQKWFNNNK